jgi:N-acetylglucosamine kinase-like BadF-type ATPase
LCYISLHPDGRQATLRALSYQLGDYGGGNDITSEAMHYAFRSNELTGENTMLEKHLPNILDAKDMNDLVGKFYPDTDPEMDSKMKKVPPLIFELAAMGDTVCQDILIKMGTILGRMTSRVIKSLNMESMEIPIVIGGSVFHGNNPLLQDAYTLTIHKTAPKAYIIIPKASPVIGAFLYGLDELKIEITNEIYENLLN